jgi:dTDP-4-amino-4,6-dideoxygalactose transaminase
VTEDQSGHLAIFGGKPTFPRPLHVGVPNIGDQRRLHERIDDILATKVLTNRGPMVVEFEERIADLVGVKHCVATSNATVALEIVTRALGFEQEVITPSMTFIATAHALQWQQITPVFCDIKPGRHHLDPARIKDLVTPRTTGLLPVNVWGRPCDIESVISVADGYGLPVVFDSAHAFGCSYKGRMVGSFGRAEVFSFHATKFLNSFEGGAVVTNDSDLADKVTLMQNFGFKGRDWVSHVGINGKMTEVEAAMGLTSLDAMEHFVAHNRENYHAYREGLQNVPGVELIDYDERERCNFQYIVLEMDERITSITRDQMMEVLKAENVDARRYFYPGCHRMEPYRSYFPNAGMLLRNTENLLDKVLTLPTGTSVTVDQVKQITSIIARVVDSGHAVSLRLRGRPGVIDRGISRKVAERGIA